MESNLAISCCGTPWFHNLISNQSLQYAISGCHLPVSWTSQLFTSLIESIPFLFSHCALCMAIRLSSSKLNGGHYFRSQFNLVRFESGIAGIAGIFVLLRIENEHGRITFVNYQIKFYASL